jgi:hypothetical protein
MVMSHSEEWVIHQGWLATQGQEGREAIRASMRELEKAGYAVHQEIREKGKIVGARWTFYDLPRPVLSRTKKTKWDQPEDGKPYDGKPSGGKPSYGNPSPLEEQEKEDKGSEEQKKKVASLSDEGKEVVEEWNSLPSPIQNVVKLSDGRRKHLYSRLKDDWWKENWKKALKSIPDSPFLTGKTEVQFKASFDFFIRPDTVAKIIEGRYAPRAGESLPSTGTKKKFTTEDHIRIMNEQYGT